MTSSNQPKRSAGDAVHALAKVAVGSIPIVGAAGAELFAYVVQAPYEKRREEWMQAAGDAIAALQQSAGIDLERLRADPAFTDTVLAATQVALHTRSEIKREALLNAIRSAASPSAPAEADQITYLRFIDELTDWHLLILRLFQDPPAWFKQNGKTPPDSYMSSLSAVLEAAFADLRGRRDQYDHWWRDLHSRGLVNTDGLHTTMTGAGALSPRTSDRGKAFLAYIRGI